MIRLALLTLYVLGLVIYAWRDWYKALCGLILLVGVVEHPDMPKTIFGIQGLNPWNLSFVSVFLAWRVQRKLEGLTWDLPRPIAAMLLGYLAVVLVGLVRLLMDQGPLGPDGDTASIISEQLVNTIKWVVPGLMLYDGCRSRERFRWGLVALLGIYFLLGVQVIRWMPIGEAVTGAELTARSIKILSDEVGFHRVNLSMMLAGASWATLAVRVLATTIPQRLVIFVVSGSLVFAQALTAGRTGYATWAVVGLALGLVRWRRYLAVVPIGALVVVSLVPGAYERMTQGFSSESRDTLDTTSEEARQMQSEAIDSDGPGPDAYTVTAGRNIAWPLVIKKIEESPIFGYGREAMVRIGLRDYLWRVFRESFPHPHNAYLELLLDNGWVGFIVVIPFYFLMLGRSLILFRDSRSALYVAAGGVSASLILALLVAAVGSQSFYPREGSVGMWCAIGLMLRVWIERSRVSALTSKLVAPPAFGSPRGAPGFVPERTQPASAAVEDLIWQRT